MRIQDRLQKLRQKLVEKELDAILISQPENRYYLSGFNGSAGFLFINSQKATLATDFRYVEQGKIQAPDYDVFKITGDMADWLPGLLAEFSLKKLGFEADFMTVATLHRLRDILSKPPAVSLVPLEGLVESLRAVKEPDEIELISRAVAIVDKAYEHVDNVAHAGMSEIGLAWEIEKFMRENGSQTLPFEIIVASGPNGALPHAKPSPRTINSGEPVVIDIGAKVEGYSSDQTRTICLGTPDSTFKKVYDIVLGAQLTAIATVKEGMTGEQADSLARTVITQAGYAEAFGHSLGHGIGLATHELPRLGPKSADILVSGTAFTIEPGIYIPGWGGVRIEDSAVMENGKVRVISKARKA